MAQLRPTVRPRLARRVRHLLLLPRPERRALARQPRRLHDVPAAGGAARALPLPRHLTRHAPR
eukprot:3553214-Prymnesium_polylepis.1